MSGEGHPADGSGDGAVRADRRRQPRREDVAAMTADFTVPNAVGVAAVAEMRRRRNRERGLGICCRDGSCETCEIEAEALKGARDE